MFKIISGSGSKNGENINNLTTDEITATMLLKHRAVQRHNAAVSKASDSVMGSEKVGKEVFKANGTRKRASLAKSSTDHRNQKPKPYFLFVCVSIFVVLHSQRTRNLELEFSILNSQFSILSGWKGRLREREGFCSNLYSEVNRSIESSQFSTSPSDSAWYS